MHLVNIEFIKENPVVIDCRYDMTNPPYGQEVYNKGHLKGAYYVDLDKDMTSPVDLHGGRHPLKDLEVFTQQMASFGIDQTTKVLIYDNGEYAMATRLWFMLRLIGLKAVYILEGGYEAIVSAGLEVTSEVPEKRHSDLVMDYQDHLICDMNYTKKALTKASSLVVDSRSPERHAGLEEPFDKIAGRIPGTVNYFWKDLFQDGRIKDYGKIEAHFLEMNNYDEVIVHCGSGITGCVNMFFMSEVGIGSKLYLGSYSDWVSYDDNEVIVKDNKKRTVK